MRLIVEGVVGPEEAVKAYHGVLGRLGIRPHRSLEVDMTLTDQSMSYAGTPKPAVAVDGARAAGAAPSAVDASNGRQEPSGPGTKPAAVASVPGAHAHSACACQSPASRPNGQGDGCACSEKPRRPQVTESYAVTRYQPQSSANGRSPSDGRPDFARMSSEERLAYHRDRLGLGR